MHRAPVTKGLNASLDRADDIALMRVRREAVLDVGGVEQVKT